MTSLSLDVDGMLLNLLRSSGLRDVLAGPDSYRPRWTASDRELWNAQSEAVRAYWIARAERHLTFEWPSLIPLYSDYAQTGNRGRFESLYHKRRQIVTTLALAEAMELRGRFIPPLLDAIAHICEEPTWVLPAHEPHAIDLFSAETGNLLAWTYYLFSDAQAFKESAVMRKAVREVHSRIITPYLTRTDCWWMALNGEAAGNWTTWCTSNCLGTVLLLETDFERRADAIVKACQSLDRFIDAYKEDGGCDEGPMYWNFAAGCLFDSLEMLFEASAGAFDVFADPAIKNIGTYIAKVHVHDLHFVNFADSPPEIPVDAALMYRFGSRSGSAHMQALGAHLYRLLDRFDPEDTLRLKMYRMLATLAGGVLPPDLPGTQPIPRDSYLPKLQVAVARQSSRSGQGLVVAAKGGHNDERHNHNDVGNVIVYFDGRPVLVDVGMKQYGRDTFTERRYDIWAMQSAYHNVPLVNGCHQAQGAQFSARDAVFDEGEDLVRFGVDIAGAYPLAAGLVRWRRECVLGRTTSTLSIHDDFTFEKAGYHFEQRFMSACQPRAVNGDLVLQLNHEQALLMRISPTPKDITLHAFSLQDGHLRHAWGEKLYQIRLHFDGSETRGECEIVMSPLQQAVSGSADSDVMIEEGALP